LPLKNKNTSIVPWDYQVGDKNYQLEPWILKKGREYVTIERDNRNRGFFHLQKDDDKRLSLNALQTKMTYFQLIEFGYKLQKQKSLRIKTKN
tara:strand:+ start:554 stop:829 length:276 start_codon:yes stop_codon:yes gene_type:complete